MKKVFFILISLYLTIFTITAIEVDEDEVNTSGSVDFINYEGVLTDHFSFAEIEQWGKNLGNQVAAERSGRASELNYEIIHSVELDVLEGLDGDILIIGPGSLPNHVDVIRFIISGYLQSAYGYNSSDAFVLAEFITYYNAVHYQNINHFSSRYKAGVLSNLSASNAGMSRYYYDWPIKSHIVIPLKDPRGDGELSNIDTSIITEEEVINEIREAESDDAGIEERKDMVDLRERELEQDQQEIEEEMQELERAREVVEDELELLEERREVNSGELSEEDQAREDELLEQQEDIEDQQEELQNEIDQATDEILDMRDDIARDENALISEGRDTDALSGRDEVENTFQNQEDQGDSPIPMDYLEYQSSGDGYVISRILKLDIREGEQIISSTLTEIYNRDLIELNGDYLVVGKDRASNEVRVMLVEKDDLAVIDTSEFEVFPGSVVEMDRDNFYIVAKGDDDKWHVARVNSSLDLVEISDTEVNPYTSITFFSGKIYYMDVNNNIIESTLDSLTSERSF